MEEKERTALKKVIRLLRTEIKTHKRDLERCREALAEVYSTKCAQCGEKKPVTVKVRELGVEKLVCIKCLKEIW